MKSLAELNAIRDKAKANMNVRDDSESSTRVLVGMATCGIAAGAKPVLTALVDEVARRNLSHVTVSQTGCIGMCQYEPIVEVLEPGKEKVTYVKVTPEMVARIVSDHLVNGNPVTEFTVALSPNNKEGNQCIVHTFLSAAVPAVLLLTAQK